MAKLNLDLTAVKEESSSKYSKVPAGIYTVGIESIEVKDTKAGGNYLEFSLQIVEGEHVGKLLVDRPNIHVPISPKATEIGLGRLKKYAIASQAKNPNMIVDTDELLTGKQFKVETSLETNKDDTGKEYEQTVIRKVFTEAADPSTTSSANSVASTAGASKAVSSKKPWEK